MAEVTFTYKTVSEQNPTDFDASVNKYLSMGYSLHGSPYFAPQNGGINGFYPYYCQALVKTDPVSSKKESGK